MRYRTYGATGKQCSVIGFGGMRFPADEDDAVRMVRRAIDLGINYFDTAPMYCDDRSEDIVGKGVAGSRDRVFLATKSSIGSDPSAADVLARIETQLKRLRTDRIDFYHMWCVMDLEQYRRVTAPGGPLEGVRKAREQGKVVHAAFSTHANGAEIAVMARSGEFEGVTLGYSVMNHTNRYAGMRAAHEAGLGVAVMNPLGGGLIAKAAERFRYLTSGPDEAPVTAALRFLLYHPEITVILCGMGSEKDVEENAAAADLVDGPDAAEAAAWKARIENLGEDYCTMCRYCMPCPSGIQIPLFVFAVERHRLNDPVGARKWLEWLKGDGHLGPGTPADCNECGECLPRCTQKLAIIEKLKKAREIFGD